MFGGKKTLEQFTFSHALLQVDMSSPLQNLIQNMEMTGDQWNDAQVKPALLYVRGSKLLRLPPEFRDAIPQYI